MDDVGGLGGGGLGQTYRNADGALREKSERGRERREEGALHKLVHLQDAVLRKVKTKAMDEGGT